MRANDPGTIGNSINDPGGTSYGPFQFSSKTGGAQAFLVSKDGQRWSGELKSLKPGTEEFNTKWRAIAAREPQFFLDAQTAHAKALYLDRTAKIVKDNSDYDLNRGSLAVRQVTFSTGVQHGAAGGSGIVTRAIAKTDPTLKRSDPGYEPALINNIYDARAEVFAKQRDRLRVLGVEAEKRGNAKAAQDFYGAAKERDNVVKRYVRERIKALILLNGEKMMNYIADFNRIMVGSGRE